MDKPSTADKTEMAGVMIPSPKNSEAPIKPIEINSNFFRWLKLVLRKFSASKAIIPPSPLLSARMTIAEYLMVMTMVMVQKIMDKIPNTFAGVMPKPCAAWKDSFNA